MPTALWEKKQKNKTKPLFLTVTDFQFCLSVINAGMFFGPEDYLRDVYSSALRKGAEQLWFHSHDTEETLRGLLLPYYMQKNMDSRRLKSIWFSE